MPTTEEPNSATEPVRSDSYARVRHARSKRAEAQSQSTDIDEATRRMAAAALALAINDLRDGLAEAKDTGDGRVEVRVHGWPVPGVAFLVRGHGGESCGS